MLSDSYMILITSDQCDPKLFLGVEEMTRTCLYCPIVS